jgi:hypothetical protein
VITIAPSANRTFTHGAFCLPLACRFFCFVFALCLCPFSAHANAQISGQVLDTQGGAVAGAHLKLVSVTGDFVRESETDSQGHFLFANIPDGQFQLTASSESFVPVTQQVHVNSSSSVELTLRFQQLAQLVLAVTVSASAPSILVPDPSQRVVVHDQVLDANPGRPGAPISLPGLPIETASGGIKAPQYFSPGVAGDHGEPIAQFFQIGNFLSNSLAIIATSI